MDDSAERPKSLRFKEPVIDIAFSPTDSLVASSLITGHVFIHHYAVAGNERKYRQRIHKKSCRSVCFSGDGASLYTASRDRSWQTLDVATGMERMRIEAAHEKPLNLVKHVNEQIVATGDESGVVKLWDVRQNKAAFIHKEHVDYISDMVFNEAKRHLLVTSGDGCLSVYDTRKAKPFMVSDNQEDELLSVAVMKEGKKVVVGETDGVLGIFTYGQFSDVTDRFPGHPQSIDSICKLTEDLCVTGSSDGLLRIVELFPHKLVGVAGDHESLPVEKVVLSYDRQWLASSSHDQSVHFWDIGYIFNEDGEDEDQEDREDQEEELDAQAMAIRITKEIEDEDDEVDVVGNDTASEIVDIVGIDDDEDDDEDEDEEVEEAKVEGDMEQKEEEESENEGDNGWGSWGDSDSDSGDTKRKPSKRDKVKAKRKAKRELAQPEAKKNKKPSKSAAFFADL